MQIQGKLWYQVTIVVNTFDSSRFVTVTLKYFLKDIRRTDQSDVRQPEEMRFNQ